MEATPGFELADRRFITFYSCYQVPFFLATTGFYIFMFYCELLNIKLLRVFIRV